MGYRPVEKREPAWHDQLQFRADLINAFNQTQFLDVITTCQGTTTCDPRVSARSRARVRRVRSSLAFDSTGDTVATMRDQIDALVAQVPEREAPLTYFYELADDGNTVTSSTFIGNVLSMAGLTSIADPAPDAAGGYPQLGAEAVLAADPAFIFLAHSDDSVPTPDEIAARPGWSELQAVRDGHVVALDPDIASRWGPRVVDLLAAVVAATSATT